MTNRQLKLTILAATWLGPQVPTLLIGVPAVYYDRISLGGMLVGAAFMLAISGGAHLMLAWMQRNDENEAKLTEAYQTWRPPIRKQELPDTKRRTARERRKRNR